MLKCQQSISKNYKVKCLEKKREIFHPNNVYLISASILGAAQEYLISKTHRSSQHSQYETSFPFEIISDKKNQNPTLGKQPKHRSMCCNNKMFKPRDTSTLERVHIHASAYNFVLMRLSNLKLNGKGMKYLLDILSYLLLSVNQLKRGLKHSTSYYDYS